MSDATTPPFAMPLALPPIPIPIAVGLAGFLGCAADEIVFTSGGTEANNLVLRLTGGIEHAVLRSDIEAMAPSTLSLMPAGFESALKPQDLADLLSWLRSP